MRARVWIFGAICPALVACGEPSGLRGAPDAEMALAEARFVKAIGEEAGGEAEYLFGSIRTVLVASTGTVWVIDASNV